MNRHFLPVFFLLAGAPIVEAAAGTVAALVGESIDAGGGAAEGGLYEHAGSLGGIGGIASLTGPVVELKAGYLGQIYTIEALEIGAIPTTVEEGALRQLTAVEILDDTSLIILAPSIVTWTVSTGPITGIASSGVATAGVVYENTAATAQGDYGGRTGMLELTVLNVNGDDFGAYAEDGLEDGWQVGFFGMDNPDAGPDIDADGDGQDNRFEFEAGTIPSDARSQFRSRVELAAGFPRRSAVIFSPRIEGRIYALQASRDLTPEGWAAVPSTSFSGDALEGTFVDTTDDGVSPKHYRVEVTRLVTE